MNTMNNDKTITLTINEYDNLVEIANEALTVAWNTCNESGTLLMLDEFINELNVIVEKYESEFPLDK
jgi:hypothetical protein